MVAFFIWLHMALFSWPNKLPYNLTKKSLTLFIRRVTQTIWSYGK